MVRWRSDLSAARAEIENLKIAGRSAEDLMEATAKELREARARIAELETEIRGQCFNAIGRAVADYDALHPNGRCGCHGEGTCQYCRLNTALERIAELEARPALDRARLVEAMMAATVEMTGQPHTPTDDDFEAFGEMADAILRHLGQEPAATEQKP